MKKIFITLLTFVFSANLFTCSASNVFDYGVDKTASFNDAATFVTDEKETIHTTIDYVPLFNRTLSVPVGQNTSALIRTFCDFESSTYDASAVLLNLYCGDKSNFTLTVSGDGYSVSGVSEDGEVAVYNIPQGEFSAYVKNDDVSDLSCETFLIGYGLDGSPEEGYNLDLECYDKDSSGGKTNIWHWLGPTIGGGLAAMSGIIAAFIKALRHR